MLSLPSLFTYQLINCTDRFCPVHWQLAWRDLHSWAMGLPEWRCVRRKFQEEQARGKGQVHVCYQQDHSVREIRWHKMDSRKLDPHSRACSRAQGSRPQITTASTLHPRPGPFQPTLLCHPNEVHVAHPFKKVKPTVIKKQS